jgi:hypothetical protein
MMDVYRVQFAYPPLSGTRSVCEQSPAPICIACSAGHHEQIVLAGESCDCPCHCTTPLESADYKVAA